MPRKGMRSIFFSSNRSGSGSPRADISASPSFSTPRRSFMESLMYQTLEQAEPVITKWDEDSSTYAKVTSLFYENRREARNFIKHVSELQKAMHSLVKENSSSEMLVRAQILMQMAMKRLQKEFYQILSMNRACLDPESVSTRSSIVSAHSALASTRSSLSDFGDESEDEIRVVDRLIEEVEDASAIAMIDLKLIAECMISNGYGKEVVHVYKLMRKSIVDEGIYKLGVEREISSKKIQKMDWEVLDIKIKNWLAAVNVAVNTLFHGEKILCDHVFASSNAVRESCFREITKDGAAILFGFPEIVVKSRKKSPEKIFRMLDMYTAIAINWPEIESIFSFDSTSPIINQALNSTIILGDSVRVTLTEFESTIHKESSKNPVAGAGIHHLTTDVMNFLSLLADYNVLGDILIDSPPPDKSSLPESYFDSYDSDEFAAPPVSLRFAWLILSLICKLDAKAEHYKDVSHSYLFLANNLQHIIKKVRTSNLKYLLGEDWIANHEAKVKLFTSKYEQFGWKSVIEAIPALPTTTNSAEIFKDSFRRFNSAFEAAIRKQSGCVIPDSKLRDEIKVSIARQLLPLYRQFYNMHADEAKKDKSHVVRFTPEDLGHALSDLFFGSGSTSTSFSGSSAGPYQIVAVRHRG